MFHTAISLLFGRENPSGEIYLQADIGHEYGRDSDRLLTVWNELPDNSIRQNILAGQFNLSKNSISKQYVKGESGRIKIIDRVSGASINYEVNNEFFSWLFWKPAENNYFCPEPHSWLINAPNSDLPWEKTGFRALQSNKELRFQTKLYYQAD